MMVEFPVERGKADAEDLRGFSLVELRKLYRISDVLTLEAFHCLSKRLNAAAPASARQKVVRKVALRDHVTVSEEHRALKHVFQLANVSLPRMVQKHLQRILIYGRKAGV